MAKKMLIDATHAEETRVAVVDGNRLAEFDYESIVRKQLKGSIFLAKVTRVEPSLQAAFVNFGGNRHGFLPFSEIHPDYYRIPIADRERLLAEEAENNKAMMEEEDDEDDHEHRAPSIDRSDEHVVVDDDDDDEEDVLEEVGGNPEGHQKSDSNESEEAEDEEGNERPTHAEHEEEEDEEEDDNFGNRIEDEEEAPDDAIGNRSSERESERSEGRRSGRNNRGRGRSGRDSRGRGRMPHRSRRVEVVGGDIDGDQPRRPNLRRQYKIQEVVKRGQIMLIQVSKEERGNKGAAVTTYLSLPGRYCVLMPNSPHGGGVSRKIASFSDRRKMKDMLSSLSVPEGMSVILRTAGVERTKAEIKRDLDYLTRLWDNIRELTLKSSAPALINEEGNLIKRAIRDLYTRDIDEVIVSGAEAYKSAKNFMKMLIPSHAKKVQEYKNDNLPLFHRYQIESQINEIGEPSVTLKSGGTIVINPTEALVSIDVNSGRATKERHIEETALKTNLEAADEVARQLRLRDLGGLVVIDFIDMEDRRNNAKVERRMKEALSSDRARIQIGRISSFGLLELSRQRMNPSLTESQFRQCPHCKGVGYIRTLDGTAIAALRAIEEVGTQRRHAEVLLTVPNEVALYILNHKRDMLVAIETRYDFRIAIRSDEATAPDKFLVEPGALRREDTETAAEPEEPQQTRNEEREQDDDGEQRNSRSGRRRGRRGGRRRRRDDRNESVGNRDDHSGNTSTERESAEESPADEAPLDGSPASQDAQSPEENAEKGKSRRPRRHRSREESVASVLDAETEAAEKDESDSSKKPARGRRRRADKSGEAEPEMPELQKAPQPAAEQANERTAPPPKEPKSSAEYQVISSAAPSGKKKGWWNKLIE
ncbi:MAG: ribonuclease E/G [Alphaproteobacteria bacterium]|nr:ribonuclease E/G [Alphaproteobacteria bacterium]